LIPASVRDEGRRRQIKRLRLIAARRQTERQYEFRGANAELHTSADEEIIISGPAGTGKSLACLDYINSLLWEYPKARALIVRKVRADLADSALLTLERDILGEDNPICSAVKREHRRIYRYPNGSTISVGGMDRPGRVMSAEYDLIYWQEAVEGDEADWEALLTRLRSGVVPFQRLIGDTNPGRPDHWIPQRAEAGLLRLPYSWHQDNPRYWDAEANAWTPEGRRYVLGTLGRLTGLRKLRLLDGKWVFAEGAIYDEWHEDVHVIDRFDLPRHWRRIISVDFGYVHPFVCQWWAVDGDGRMALYREIYYTRRLVEEHAAKIAEYNETDRDAGAFIELMVCDHDAEGRATLEKYTGMKATGADKRVLAGIQAVQSRIKVHHDGLPRIRIFRDALVERDPELAEAKLPSSTREEVGGYVWADSKTKEAPVKVDDHGLDDMRYAVMAIDAPTASAGARAVVTRRHGGRRLREGRRRR
jgi:phage terminase large subunit